MAVCPCKCVQNINLSYLVVMPKIMGWKCNAQARAAAMNALGCSWRTESDKVISIRTYAEHGMYKESTSYTVEILICY